MGELERIARGHGVSVLRLDTRHDLVEARRLYATLGYQGCLPSTTGSTPSTGWQSRWPSGHWREGNAPYADRPTDIERGSGPVIVPMRKAQGWSLSPDQRPTPGRSSRHHEENPSCYRSSSPARSMRTSIRSPKLVSPQAKSPRSTPAPKSTTAAHGAAPPSSCA